MNIDAAVPADDHQHELQATYRYLRLAIILLTLLLGLSVGLQIGRDGGSVLPSVSAYYYSPARDVFVASLCAIGTCLIIHRGRSDTEDVLLNASGYLAFFVAFVPTAPVGAQARSEIGAQIEVPVDFVAAVTQNTWAILVVGLVGLILEVTVVPQRERHLGSSGAKGALGVSALAYVGLAGYFIFARESFFHYGHGIAAIILFLGIVGIVGVNGIALVRRRAESGLAAKEQWLNRYTFGFVLMIVTTVLVIGPVRLLVDQWIFILEALLILQFLAFWVTQTVERWHAPVVRQDLLMPG